MLLVPLLSLGYIIAVALNRMAGFLFGFNEVYTTPSLIKQALYPVESHTAITEDGYILTIHRIPHGKDPKVASKGPVFLMHGLLCSSADWIVSGSKSLGFSLADAGFDVWMGNNRGNTYSRDHLFPNLDTKAFYDYSYNEIGKYDVPAMIDYVLNETKKDKLGYVGFSEGVTSFFVMMSYHPEYNKKISTAVAWAPVTDMFKTQSKVISSLAKSRILEWIAEHSKWYELLPYRKVGNTFRALCRTSYHLCSWLFELTGSSKQHMPNQAFKDQILYNFPAGMSLKQLLHYVQGARTGYFRPYVYSTEKENLQVYHKVVPDSYNLSAVTAPITLFYGGSDIYIDNEQLLNNVVTQLKNAKITLVPIDDFNHLDFIWNKDDDWLLNETIEKLEAASNQNETTSSISTATSMTSSGSSTTPTTSSSSSETPTISSNSSETLTTISSSNATTTTSPSTNATTKKT